MIVREIMYLCDLCLEKLAETCILHAFVNDSTKLKDVVRMFLQDNILELPVVDNIRRVIIIASMGGSPELGGPVK
jgi:hypothetical protein